MTINKKKYISEISKNELIKKIPEMGKLEAARHFGVSFLTITKFAKNLNLEFKKNKGGRPKISLY